jgi:RHS repeat-associated protein
LVTVDATTNRITGAGYSYDSNGNMTADGLNSLVYDAENRLVTSSGSTYSYDGNNLRVQKVASGTTTVYIFSGTKVIAEYVNGAAVGSPTREYIYSGSQLVSTIESGTTKYHHTDHLSPRLTTDTSGNVLGQQGHYPYGESWYLSSTTTKWQFTSYERDAESGNDYAVFRYYLNRLGRFSSADPLAGSIADPQSLDRYSYARGDPIDATDPLGLLAWVCLKPCVIVDGKKTCEPDYCFWQEEPSDPWGGPYTVTNLREWDDRNGIPSDKPQPPAPTKVEQIVQQCNQIRAAGGRQLKIGGATLSFNSAGTLSAFSVPLPGDNRQFASAQLVGRDPLGNATIVFSFNKPLTVSGGSLDSSLFESRQGFIAASGTVFGVGGRIGEAILLRGLNSSREALAAARASSQFLGQKCEGILFWLGVAGVF